MPAQLSAGGVALRACRRHDCDLLLDQTIGRDERSYFELVPANCRRLLGTDYALLRSQFVERRVEAVRRRALPRPARRIQISMGMTDPHRLAYRILGPLLALAPAIAIDVASGTNPDAMLLKLASTYPEGVTVYGLVD